MKKLCIFFICFLSINFLVFSEGTVEEIGNKVDEVVIDFKFPDDEYISIVKDCVFGQEFFGSTVTHQIMCNFFSYVADYTINPKQISWGINGKTATGKVVTATYGNGIIFIPTTVNGDYIEFNLGNVYMIVGGETRYNFLTAEADSTAVDDWFSNILNQSIQDSMDRANEQYLRRRNGF